MNRTIFLYDCIRSPFDIAQIIQMRAKTNIEVVTSRSSLPYNHQKVLQKCSIKKSNIKQIINYENLEELIRDYKKNNFMLVGTSPVSCKSLYDLDIKNKDIVFVYGNESSGLPAKVQDMMDEMIILPMNVENLDFMTLPVVTGAITVETYRQNYGTKIQELSICNNNNIDIVFSNINSFYDSCLMLQTILALDFNTINIYTTTDNLDLTSNKVKAKVLSWRAKNIPNIIKCKTLNEIIISLKEKNKFIIGTYLKGDSGCHYQTLINYNFYDKDIALIIGDIPDDLKKQLNYMLPFPLDDSKSMPINFSSILFELYRQKRVKVSGGLNE